MSWSCSHHLWVRRQRTFGFRRRLSQHVRHFQPSAHTIVSIRLMMMCRPEDRELMHWAYKRSRELARRLPSYRGEFSPGHPEFSPISAAATNVTEPAAISAPDLTYTAEDDKAIDTYINKAVTTAWHSVGFNLFNNQLVSPFANVRLVLVP